MAIQQPDEREKPWEIEDWRKAEGINCSIKQTNAGLACRDYSVPCNTPSRNLISEVAGYFIWWCSAHHQPLPWCNLGREKQGRQAAIDRAVGEAQKPLLDALQKIVNRAAPDGTQEDGDYVGFYVVPTGPIHLAIPLLQAAGRDAQSHNVPEAVERYQAHLAQLHHSQSAGQEK